MKNLFTYILLLSTITLSAQKGHYISFGGDVGEAGIKYNLPNGYNNLGIGYGGKLWYSYFFSKNIGVTAGVNISSSHSVGGLNAGLLLEKEDTDSEGIVNTRKLYLHSWEEKQNIISNEIPILLSYQHELSKDSKWKIYINAGVKIQQIINASYKVENPDFERVATYNQWNITFRDIPKQDLERITNEEYSGTFKLKNSIIPTVNVGLFYSIAEYWDLYTGVFFDYGIKDIKVDGEYTGFESKLDGNDAPLVNQSISVMSDDIKNLAMKAEIGLRYRLHKKEKKEESKEEVLEEKPLEKQVIQTEVYKDTICLEEYILKDEYVEEEEECDTLLVVKSNIAPKENESDELTEQKYIDTLATYKKVEVKELPKKDTVMVKIEQTEIYFKLSKYILTEKQKEYIGELATKLDGNPDLKIKIIGHTCNVGSTSVNDIIGLLRAQKIGDYLIEKGIDEDRLLIESEGERNPAYDNKTREGRIKNRRVEINIINSK